MTTAMIKIVDYEPKHQPHFDRLNKAWIEKYFWLEPIDEFVLGSPEEAILKAGGYIFMAMYGNDVAGTVALLKVDDTTYEFTKMAVDEGYRRKGIAEALSLAAISKARELRADNIILYSQTGLTAAILLYRKLGFEEVPLDAGVYKRSDIKMQLQLNNQL